MSGPLRIALVGKAGAGKDYFVKVLRRQRVHVRRFAYADALKCDVAAMLRPMPTRGVLDDGRLTQGAYRELIGWVDARKHLPWLRALLQAYGEAAKAARGDEEYWANRCRQDYEPCLSSRVLDAIVITDLRVLPEAAHARRDGFAIVRITRKDGYEHPSMTAEAKAHRSEVEQDQIAVDYEIVNGGTAQFDRVVMTLLEIMREQDASAGEPMMTGDT